MGFSGFLNGGLDDYLVMESRQHREASKRFDSRTGSRTRGNYANRGMNHNGGRGGFGNTGRPRGGRGASRLAPTSRGPSMD